MVQTLAWRGRSEAARAPTASSAAATMVTMTGTRMPASAGMRATA